MSEYENSVEEIKRFFSRLKKFYIVSKLGDINIKRNVSLFLLPRSYFPFLALLSLSILHRLE